MQQTNIEVGHSGEHQQEGQLHNFLSLFRRQHRASGASVCQYSHSTVHQMASRESVQYLQACLSFKKKMIIFNNLNDPGKVCFCCSICLCSFSLRIIIRREKKLFVYTGNGSKLSTDRNNWKIGSFSTKNRNFNTQK